MYHFIVPIYFLFFASCSSADPEPILSDPLPIIHNNNFDYDLDGWDYSILEWQYKIGGFATYDGHRSTPLSQPLTSGKYKIGIAVYSENDFAIMKINNRFQVLNGGDNNLVYQIEIDDDTLSIELRSYTAKNILVEIDSIYIIE